MLKALELFGFKSFADRTRFDFPDGITVIVGPNGSGKSNIVDAIKWVLGSQSPKSLRGKEMADVIFKGSQERKGAGAAEASIIFDNESGRLPYDAAEVYVTRRVYLSGEGEYLINGAPCRLKDVKELVRITGIGIDAYSLIEQGKVDRLLQANPKERRAIFEEAAGISRFKAKKVEAGRRLARVDQNLARLGDIVDEVATRLQSLKSQASKAERYRQASQRLRLLRTQLAWTDWNELSQVLEQAQSQLAEAAAAHEAVQAERDALVEARQQLEIELQDAATAAQAEESRRAEVARRIASLSGSGEADAATLDDLQQRIAAGRRRVRLLRSKAGTAVAQLRRLRQTLQEAQAELETATQTARQAESVRDAARERVDAARAESDDVQQRHLAALRQAADLEGALQRLEQQIAEGRRASDNLQRRHQAAEEAVAHSAHEVQTCEQRLEQLDEKIAAAAAQIETQQAQLHESRRVLERRRAEIASLEMRLQGVTERLTVLEDLERRREGIQSGVKSLLEQAQGTDEGPLADLIGLVADQLETDVHVAPLIDVALGGRAQYAVVRGDAIQRAILAEKIRPAGRVGLIRIDELPPHRPGDRIRLDGLKGVLGRADRMVRTTTELEPLARHLLGTTWLVDTLATAWGLRKLSGAGLRFVSGGCELLETDGSVVVGPAHAAAGPVSRRSELAAARQELKHYRYQLAEGGEEASRLAAQVDQQAARLGRQEQAHREQVTARAAAEATHRAASDQLASRRGALEDLVAEQTEVLAHCQQAESKRTHATGQLEACRGEIVALDQSADAIAQELQQAQAELRGAADAVMQRSVELARVEQRVESLLATLDQQQRDQQQREAAVTEVREALAADGVRAEAIQLRMLRAGAELAERSLEGESAQQQIAVLAEQVAALRARQRQQQREIDAVGRQVSKAAEALHALERRRDEAQLHRTNLAQRLLEDYQLDLHQEEPPEDFQPPEDRAAVDAEIAQLREQLQRTGAINMSALEELDQLQHRYDELHGQYQDLSAAKDSLERIIQRINADSRRLFVDTLEAIRTNFQILYRRSFGGGSADLVLEDAADPLEAGVEILATPPGKPSFSNSLLSGGEKALTAVALLMAIFQFRPSPVCVMDEVDAPFDEANIGRFVAVLQELLGQTKFVVVTHSKKTMTAATTLYGVTMQESGVSKQVSVRFEDVADDGQIREAAEQTNDEADRRGVA